MITMSWLSPPPITVEGEGTGCLLHRTLDCTRFQLTTDVFWMKWSQTVSYNLCFH